MSDKLYRRMILRKRLCKRCLFMLVTFGISFYTSLLLFGDLKSPVVMRMTDLNRCPACYGISVCAELYSNQIIIESGGTHWSRLFNAKNVYYGFTKTNKRVVLKKLAHDWELKNFDSNLCKSLELHSNCQPNDLLNITNIEEHIIKTVQYNLSWPVVEPRKGLVMCPYASSIYYLIQPILKDKHSNKKSDMANIWTTLSINPEPIILQVLQKSRGWPVPAWGGVCGRLEVVTHDGDPLSALTHIAWHRRLLHAKKILNAALDFTYKHDRFRFYLMDWSLDNIVVNEKDDVSFVDLEDVVVLDKFISPGTELPNWYVRYTRENLGPGFTFSIDGMCRHHLSDHNLWAACYVLAGDDRPYLYPIPSYIRESKPHFHNLLYECLNGDDRFATVSKLQQLINNMLSDEGIVGFGGAVR